MRFFHRSLLFAACLCGLSCSALSDFDGYEFNEPRADGGHDRDGGGGESGGAGESGEGGAGAGGEAGESGQGGRDGGDTGGSGGSGGDSGSGGSGGDSGQGGSGGETGGSGGQGGDSGIEPECTEASDCEDNETCVNEMCVPIRIPSGVLQTAGGGDITSTNYTLRVSIGAPQPMGRASSSNFIVTVGPGAGRP